MVQDVLDYIFSCSLVKLELDDNLPSNCLRYTSSKPLNTWNSVTLFGVLFNQYRTGKTPDFGDNHVNQHRPNLESAVCIVEIR